MKAPGVGAFLSFMGHYVMEHRNGLVVTSEVSQATDRVERGAALRMARSLKGAYQKTVGSDKDYDTRDFVADIPINGITPHMAQKTQPRLSSAIDGRTVSLEGMPNRSTSERGSRRSLFGSGRPLACGSSRTEAGQRLGRCSGSMWSPTT